MKLVLAKGTLVPRASWNHKRSAFVATQRKMKRARVAAPAGMVAPRAGQAAPAAQTTWQARAQAAEEGDDPYAEVRAAVCGLPVGVLMKDHPLRHPPQVDEWVVGETGLWQRVEETEGLTGPVNPFFESAEKVANPLLEQRQPPVPCV